MSVTVGDSSHVIIYLPSAFEPYFTASRCTFKQIVDEFEQYNRPSTVGVRGEGNVKLEEVRSSSQFSFKNIFGSVSYDLGKLVEPHETLYFDMNMDYKHNNRKWDLIGYGPGDLFELHTDGQKHKDHIGTVLLFPPKGKHEFEGGDLILQLKDKEVVLKPSTFKYWTLVAFKLDVPHKCTPVTSGKRYVFKTELEFERVLSFDIKTPGQKISSNKIEQAYVDIEKKYTQKIEELYNKIKRKQEIIESMKNGNVTPNVKRVLDNIDNNRNKFGFKHNNRVCIVVLQQYYGDLNHDNLKGEDALLWQEIVEKYPMCNLQNISKVESNRGDGQGACDELSFDEDMGDFPIYYNFNPAKFIPGKECDSDCRYNDQTYDDVRILKVTAICIRK